MTQNQTVKLTQKGIATLQLARGKSEQIFFDEALPGFGLRYRAGGSKTWIYQFKLGNKQRRLSFGYYPAISPDAARKTAAEMHAKVRLGVDPVAQKVESRAKVAETMEAALRSYLPFKKDRLKPRSYIEMERHLLLHGKPLHELQLAKIDRRAIATRLVEITRDSGAVTSNRVRASLSAFFSWGIQQGLIDRNPVVGTGREQERSRERVLSDSELAAIWNGLEDDDFGAIIKLLVLTGQRASEIAGLRWSEINDDKITLPPERTKNARGHQIPLSAPALNILQSVKQRKDRDFLFGRRAGPFIGWVSPRRRLDARIAEATGAPLPHWTPHDIRRSVATQMGEQLAVAPHIVEAILNHVSGTKSGVAGIYNRAVYAEEKRRALNLWGAHVMAIVEGRARNIVPPRA
jgi:integrase